MARPITTTHGEYSMGVVSRLTGLGADTIRAWERRYGAVVPARTAGNSRRYGAADVRRLALLREATRRGHRIGDIARLDEPELASLAGAGDSGAGASSLDSTGLDGAFELVARDYLEAVSRFESRSAADMLARAAAVFRPRDFVLALLLPVMRETGDRWEDGTFTVAHEHLVTMQVRSLLEAMLRLSSPHPGAPKVIAATPEGHLHEFGALAGAMLAAMRGFDVLYLGPSLPESDLLHAVGESGARVALLSVVLRGRRSVTTSLGESIARISRRVETWVGVEHDHPLVARLDRARPFHDFDELDLALTSLLG